jgi:hypothetical protein
MMLSARASMKSAYTLLYAHLQGCSGADPPIWRDLVAARPHHRLDTPLSLSHGQPQRKTKASTNEQRRRSRTEEEEGRRRLFLLDCVWAC